MGAWRQVRAFALHEAMAPRATRRRQGVGGVYVCVGWVGVRKSLRTTLLSRILLSSVSSSLMAMQMVSFLFLPLMSTVSPRNSSSSGGVWFG